MNKNFLIRIIQKVENMVLTKITKFMGIFLMTKPLFKLYLHLPQTSGVSVLLAVFIAAQCSTDHNKTRISII